jgi:hypothetical protein
VTSQYNAVEKRKRRKAKILRQKDKVKEAIVKSKNGKKQ